ncbi:MAG: N-6 DNA methylase, partial [Alphaproteobacteria bacterium]|nr:N-6 DNA methylase [Alphaproteobacteria bacterium]
IEIRKKLIENDKIEAIIVLPRELFYTTDISVTLWILNQNKKGGMWHGIQQRKREREILFMDLRQWTDNAVKGEQKKKVELNAIQIQRAANIYFEWQAEKTLGCDYAEPELYRSVEFSEIEKNGYSLVPSRYIEFVDRDSDIDYNTVLTETASTVSDLLKRQKQNDETLRNALKQLGYECE